MEVTGSAYLRKAAPDWNLAGDKHLLGLLEHMHQNIITKCQEVTTRLDDLVTTLDNADIDLQNVNNKFMALSNRQFVESRVYEDDADVSEEIHKTDLPLVVEPENEWLTIKRSLHSLEELHESVRILESDSSDDEDEGRLILKPKDIYSERPLPHIIGSNAWRDKWHVGLAAEDSDSSGGQISPESESDSTASDSEHDLERDPESKPEPVPEHGRSVVLAGPVAKFPEPSAEPPRPAPRVFSSAAHSATSTIFFDEPPPWDPTETDEDSEDDIFAELHRTAPGPASGAAPPRRDIAGDLFGGDEFYSDGNEHRDQADVAEPYKSGAEKPTLNKGSLAPNPNSQEEHLPDAENSTNRDTQIHGDSDAKKPVGGISLFGSNQGTRSIGAAILKRNQRKTSSDEESGADEEGPTPTATTKTIGKNNDKPINTESDVIKSLFAKPNQLKKDKINAKIDTAIIIEKPQEKVDLFSDSLFDDIDDIFTTDVVPKPIISNINKKSLFDDDYDDLFTDVAIKTEEKSEENNRTTSIFDNEDELFNNNVIKQPSPSQLRKDLKEDRDSSKIKEKQVQKPKSIFYDSDDELFSNETCITSVKSANKNKDNASATKNDDNVKEIKKSNEGISIDKKELIFIEPKEKKCDIENNDFDVQKSRLGGKVTANPEDIFCDNILVDTITKSATVSQQKKYSSSESIVPNSTNNEGNIGITYSSETFESPSIFDDDEIIESTNEKSQSDEKRHQVQNEHHYGEHREEVQPSVRPRLANNIENMDDLNIIYDFECMKHDDYHKNDTTFKSNKMESNKNMTTCDPPQKDLNENNQKSSAAEQSEKKVDDIPNLSPHKQDTFESVFDDVPPAFEKPTELKKSKNINALFDDDSDDEALFFKKDDFVSDEKPDLSISDERFRIFHDEPPDIDFDFSQKPSRHLDHEAGEQKYLVEDEFYFKNNLETEEHNQQTNDTMDTIPEEFYSNSLNKHNEDIKNVNTHNHKSGNVNISDALKVQELHKESDLVLGETKSKIEYTEHSKKDKAESPKIETKKIIGKLIPTSLNINVNSLLPGTVKNIKTGDEIDNQTLSMQSNEELNKSVSDKIESKLMKSVSFDNSEPGILDNKLSKERARIQIKRRPSSRRARLEAVRKSGIDFGDDSAVNSNSFDESITIPPQTTTTESESKKNGYEILKANKKLTTNILCPISPTITAQDNDKECRTRVENIHKTANKTNVNSKDLTIEFQCDQHTYKSTVDQEVVDGVNPALGTDKILRNTPNDNISQKFVDELIDPVVNSFSSDNTMPKVQNAISATDKWQNNAKSKSTDVKSKVVYILNDEDIFTNTKIETTNQKKALTITDSDDEDLFKNLPKISTLVVSNVDLKVPSPEVKKEFSNTNLFDDLSDDEDLFKGRKSHTDNKMERNQKTSEANPVRKKETRNKSLFGDESDEDLFYSKLSSSTETRKAFRSREMATTSDLATEDPLSLLTDDS